MTAEQIAKSVSYCGLLCRLCNPDGGCDCRSANQCGKRASPGGCYQYECCTKNGYQGCWECPDFCCGKDMFNEQHLRLKTFVKCIREDGLERFARYIARNLENGIVYHRDGFTGDYDLDTEEAILRLLRSGQFDDRS